MLPWLFWLTLFLSAYSYFFYPLILTALIPLQARRAVGNGPLNPSMTLIVTAFNEQGRIEAKLKNSLQIDYPGLTLLVASDCSSDNTDDIVRSYANQGVQLVRATERLGKENAQLCAIRQAQSEILVFSDVATEIPTDALQKLAAYFSDPQVGAISSEDRFIAEGDKIVGEGAYVKYEMWLRRLESKLGGIVGLSGSFFAARRSLCQQWDIHSPSDFNTALNCARAKLRAVTAPDVVGYYKDLKDPKKEYQRKVRTVLRGITAVARHRQILSPRQYGLFAFQVISHKILRWAVPWLMIAAFALNLALLEYGLLYRAIFAMQAIFYAVALVAHCAPSIRDIGVVRIVYFFVQANVGIADACLRFWTGKRITTWQPSAR